MSAAGLRYADDEESTNFSVASIKAKPQAGATRLIGLNWMVVVRLYIRQLYYYPLK